jgi:ABC-2 type transport system ATP-binding protein
MDEAERCHVLVAIADGRLIAEGSVEEVIAQAGLTTWTVRGGPIMAIRNALEGNPAVTTMAPFGSVLHICGTDAVALDAAVAPFRDAGQGTWQAEPPSLEDAFIFYMTHRHGGSA